MIILYDIYQNAKRPGQLLITLLFKNSFDVQHQQNFLFQEVIALPDLVFQFTRNKTN